MLRLVRLKDSRIQTAAGEHRLMGLLEHPEGSGIGAKGLIEEFARQRLGWLVVGSTRALGRGLLRTEVFVVTKHADSAVRAALESYCLACGCEESFDSSLAVESLRRIAKNLGEEPMRVPVARRIRTSLDAYILAIDVALESMWDPK
ncbi:MAG: hypothetical protein WCI75_21170, partial [candidate division NC10 bacterium]